MRILQFNSYADPVGGAEVYALALTRELRRRGHDVGFFGTSPDREEKGKSLRVVRRPRYEPALLTRDPAARTALEETVRELRPEVIHVHNVYAMGVDVLEALGAARVPVVQTVHDFSLLCPNSWCVLADGTICPGGAGAKCFQNDCKKNYPYDAEVALHTLLRQRVMSAIVDVAVCPSRYLAERTRASGARDVRHLNYFIDPIAAAPSEERAARQLIYIGRLEPEKGVEYLLEAMPLIRQRQPEVRLTVVGGGSLAEALQARAARSNLGEAVTFVSHVPREELGRFYSTATACVVPSIWSENSPLVAYECLFAGLPMIASRIGGIPELVEEGLAGFTFTPRDARDLAEKALRLLELSPSDRARLSTAMRQRAQDFRPEPHLERVEDLYREVVRTGARGTPPMVPVNADLLAILEQCGRERSHLAGLYHEHVEHIRRLEQGLSEVRSEREPVSGDGSRQLEARLQELEDRQQQLEDRQRRLEDRERGLGPHREHAEALETMGPRELLSRLRRALRRSRRA